MSACLGVSVMCWLKFQTYQSGCFMMLFCSRGVLHFGRRERHVIALCEFSKWLGYFELPAVWYRTLPFLNREIWFR